MKEVTQVIITIVNNKGGVGKTVSSVNLAAALATILFGHRSYVKNVYSTIVTSSCYPTVCTKECVIMTCSGKSQYSITG
jgi:hypothetical protein